MRKMVLCLSVMFVAVSILAGKVFQERLNYSIILPENPSETVQFAGEELKKFLEETYDKPVKFNGNEEKIIFYAGVSSEAVMDGFTGLPPIENKFGVFVKSRSILFFGFDDEDTSPENSLAGHSGTLLSVYYFLNKYVGTGFYFPGDKGYSVSKNKAIELKENDIPDPAFELRGFYTYTKEFSTRDMNVFFRRMLCCLPYWGKQDLYYIFMYNWKKRFWEKHPEYFMMRDGKRISERYPLHAPCLSNPDVVKQTAADIIEAINKKPSIKTVRIFCDAPIYQCQCEKCKTSRERALAGGIDEKSGEEVYGFQKKVADIVWESHPDIFFLTQTKGKSYYNPPKLIKLGPKFTVQVLNQRAFDTDNWREPLEIVKAWKQAGVRTFLKSYPRYPEWKWYPVINPVKTLDYFKAFKGLTSGAICSDLSNNSPYSFSAFGHFMQAKALFDTNTSFEKLLDEFCAFAYPGAEKGMMEFYKEMDKICALGTARGNPLLSAYTLENLKKPAELMDKASKKTDSVWFRKLYDDFKKFYAHAEKEAAKTKEMLSKSVKVLSVPILKKSPGMNGQPEPETWKDFTKKEFMATGGYDDLQKTYMSIACDKENLYIGIEAFEKETASLLASCKENGKGPLWSDDCIEIMLVPSGNIKEKDYYQIVVNSLGAYRVLKYIKGKSGDDNDFKISVKAEVKKDKWLLFTSIPLSQFSKGSFDHPWRFCAFRSRYLNDITRREKTGQCSGINLIGRGYHNLMTYPELIWPEKLKK